MARIDIPIMFCFDTNYVIPAAVAFYSLLEHANKDYNYTLYVLHSDINNYQQEKLHETIKDFANAKIIFIDMNHRLDDFWNNNYKGGHFSKEVMYKLLVASIFPNLDKLIVSDVDVVFLGDISESFFDLTDEDDAYIAGVKPIGKIAYYLDSYYPDWTKEEVSKLGNICGGYLVMNLKKIREDNFESVFLKSLDENGYRLNQMEQDIFNITCYGKLKHLHLKYVACSYMWDYYQTEEDKQTDLNYTEKEITEAMEHPIQLHYATSIKPWKNVDCTKSNEWFKYIVKTPFLEEYLHALPEKIVIPNYRKQNIITEVNVKESIYRKIANRIPKSIRLVAKHPKMLLGEDNRKRVRRKLFKKNYSYIIFDDVFPSNLSPFRYTEFMEYSLDNINTYIATTGESLHLLNEKRELKQIIEEFQVNNPVFYNKIFDVSEKNREESLKKIKNIKNPLAIFVFKSNILNQTYDNLTFLEENNIPFIITLYPGGSFKINDVETDKALKRIFNSKCFRKAIVTQHNVRDYLLNKSICNESDIEFIFGIVTQKNVLSKDKVNRLYYPIKKHFDVCFVAHKYMKNGEDKGYDLFIESAKKIIDELSIKDIRFHVVGEFNKDDINVSSLGKKIKFYEILSEENLINLYKKMDIIVSPTRPYILSSGSFDGFPTGATSSAMLRGVVAITTDELHLNHGLFSDKEIIIVKPNVSEIVKCLLELYNNPDKLKEFGTMGRLKATRVYSYKNQMGRRLKLLNKIAKKEYK